MKPRIGIIPGDPGGIGPELVAKLLAEDELHGQADTLLIGDSHVFLAGQSHAGTDRVLVPVDARSEHWQSVDGSAIHVHPTIRPEDVQMAQVSEASGRSALANLDLALDFASEGVIDAIVFGPFNKAALHLAGLGHDDELQYSAARLELEGHASELNTLEGLWTGRVTSHIPLREVADRITGQRITDAVLLIDRTLRRSGVARPRIAVAALNPHAGDGGNFGREELDVIGPAVENLAGMQLAVEGPFPSDTIFLRALDGELDAVVTMYHDQGQIALKLIGFDRGVTVLGGLPFPVTTPAHGSAFDIAGSGTANPSAIRAAFRLACDMVRNWEAVS